jgi:hypothetical protein
VTRPIAVVLLVAALLAGCGGGGDDQSSTMSKERYVAEGDVVCAELTDRFAGAGATDPQTPQEIEHAADVLAGLYGELDKGLRDIRLPTAPADRRGALAYLAAVRRTDPLLARLRASAQRFAAAAADGGGGGDRVELAQAGNAVRGALDAFRAAQAQADRRALDYGFNYCGNLD